MSSCTCVEVMTMAGDQVVPCRCAPACGNCDGRRCMSCCFREPHGKCENDCPLCCFLPDPNQTDPFLLEIQAMCDLVIQADKDKHDSGADLCKSGRLICVYHDAYAKGARDMAAFFLQENL